MGGFLELIESAKVELRSRGVELPLKMDRDGAIKDLELQWQDHFHMRDQTWKTLNNAALMFVGVVGLEIYKGAPNSVMIAGYAGLLLLSLLGLFVAIQHRHIQKKIKFPIIIRYEIMLGLTPVFEDILDRRSVKGPSTPTFIIASHAALAVVALLLLGRKLCVSTGAACPAALLS